MNNIITNEISSNEQTIESSLKIHQFKEKEEPKNSLLINPQRNDLMNIGNLDLKKEKYIITNVKTKIRSKRFQKLKFEKNISSNVLDYDEILNFLYQSSEKKINTVKNRIKRRKNLIGFLRKKIKRQNISKTIFFNTNSII